MKGDNYDNISDEQLIEIARAKLPLPSQSMADYYIVPIASYKSNFPNPLTSTSPYPEQRGEVKIIDVVFVKTYVRDIAIGWEFDQMNR